MTIAIKTPIERRPRCWRWHQSPRYELVDGKLVAMPPKKLTQECPRQPRFKSRSPGKANEAHATNDRNMLHGAFLSIGWLDILAKVGTPF